ncbi:hypothetical protein KY289_010959 [Solanum tuberosum]|nr:hypothetical protein KY289_010959 [Solanum tuberosum]
MMKKLRSCTTKVKTLHVMSYKLNDSFPHSDNVFVESVHTQVDPIDDQIDSSCKINICPPSVDTCALSDITLSCSSFPCFDNVPIENVDTLVDPIDDQINSSSKINLCPPSVDTCALNASSLSSDIGVDKLVCNNPLFDVDITNDGEMHSVVSWQDRIVIPLEGYQVIENTLWYIDTLSKDGTLVLEDDSTSIGGVSGQKEEDVCSPMSLSFLCDLILYQGLNACGSKCDSICGHILDEVHLCNTFIYYLFAYDDVHTFEWSMILDDKSVNRMISTVWRNLLAPFPMMESSS